MLQTYLKYKLSTKLFYVKTNEEKNNKGVPIIHNVAKKEIKLKNQEI